MAKWWWEQKGIELVGVWEEEATGRPEELEGSYSNKTGRRSGRNNVANLTPTWTDTSGSTASYIGCNTTTQY